VEFENEIKGVPAKTDYVIKIANEFNDKRIKCNGSQKKRSYRNSLKKRFLNSTFGDECRKTAIRILHKLCVLLSIENIELDDFKFLVYWVQFKCSANFSKSADFFTNITENDIQQYAKEFEKLVKAVGKCKAVTFEFLYQYSKAYHVNAHYTEIRDAHKTLQESDAIPGSSVFANFRAHSFPNVLSLMPDIDVSKVTELQECADYYLNTTADFVFNKDLYKELCDNDNYYCVVRRRDSTNVFEDFYAGQIIGHGYSNLRKSVATTIYTAY
jgi:hypothetical protein